MAFVVWSALHLRSFFQPTHGPSTAGTTPPAGMAFANASSDFVLQSGFRPSSSSIANGRLARAIQEFKDGASEAARVSCATASDADPSFGAPLLLALQAGGSWASEQNRHEFAAAMALRESLSQRDSALLDAFEPATRMPPDYQLALDRHRALATKLPADVFVMRAYANALIRLGYLKEAVGALGPLPALPALLSLKGLALALDFDADGARATFQECIDQSPHATSCLRQLIFLLNNDGECERAADLSRQYIAAESQSTDGYMLLAAALSGMEAPRSALRQALGQAWNVAPPDPRNLRTLANEAALSLLDGDFDGALLISKRWAHALSSDADELAQMEAARFRVNVAFELDNNRLADEEAHEFIDRHAALLVHGYSAGDFALEATGYRLRAGIADRAALLQQRSSLMGHGAESLVEIDAMRWLRAYGMNAYDEDTAREAAGLWTGRPEVLDPLTRNVGYDLPVGRVYRLAHRLDLARPLLERGARSCDVVELPAESTWAHLELAKLTQELGETAAACDQYAVVLRRWGRETRSVSARKARAARHELACPD